MMVFARSLSACQPLRDASRPSARVSTRGLVAVAAVALLSLPFTQGEAQGALSAQGFGYPNGGLSTRSLGTAGSTSEFDLLSARNPAALTGLTSTVLSVQGEPEWRSLRTGELTERSLLQRTPLVAAGLRVNRFAVMISSSTLLDRTFATESPGSTIIDGIPITTTDRLESRGGMSELRLSAGWQWRSLGLGVAAVGITGEHDVIRARNFADTLAFGNVRDSARLGFQGVGAAVGVNWRPAEDLLIGASYLIGGRLNALRNSVSVASASVPDRIGLGVLYEAGATVLAASVEQVGWSGMNGLGGEAAVAQDATNWSLGLEFPVGAFRRVPILWRVGYAQRDLPFLLRDLPVTERGFHGGVGIPLAGEFATLDFALRNAQRRVTGDAAQENGLGFSAALTIRP